MQGSRELEKVKKRDKFFKEPDWDALEKEQKMKELRHKKRERKSNEDPEEE